MLSARLCGNAVVLHHLNVSDVKFHFKTYSSFLDKNAVSELSSRLLALILISSFPFCLCSDGFVVAVYWPSCFIHDSQVSLHSTEPSEERDDELG